MGLEFPWLDSIITWSAHTNSVVEFQLGLEVGGRKRALDRNGTTYLKQHNRALKGRGDFPLKPGVEGLERWFSGQEHLLLLQKTRVWWLTIIYNLSSRGANLFFWPLKVLGMCVVPR